MPSLNLSDAEARLAELADRVEAGETFEIVRSGKPVMRLVPIEPAKKKIDVAALREAVRKQPYQEISGAQIIREMRDSGY